jgi:hypothetical protein
MARTIKILYEHFTTSCAHMGKKFWSGIFKDTGEGYDYGTKQQLIEECKEDGYNYEVIRQHRDGTQSVIERGTVNRLNLTTYEKDKMETFKK